MFTCGLYDHAGEWAYNVGLPAKSGVGGGLMAVVNRQLGIAVYSPRLDGKGNSVRGIMVCKELASRLGLHAFEFTNVGSSATKIGGTLLGGMEFFTSKTFSVKGEARYNLVQKSGPYDPSGLSLAIGVKSYF